MIADYLEKVNEWRQEHTTDLFTAVVIFLIGMGGFGLGRVSVLWREKTPLEITEPGGAEAAQEPSSPFGAGDGQTASAANSARTSAGDARGRYIASRSGAFYHYPWCPGAAKIKEGNKIWFATKEEAVAKGYKPASNCPGL